MNKRNKGITLIALIITIIILLILAGIVFSLTLTQNSLMDKTKDVAREYEKGEIIERIIIDLADAQAEELSKGNTIQKDKIEEILDKYGEITKNDDDSIKGVVPDGKDFEISVEEVWQGPIEQIAGLYKNGTLVYNWNELQERNIIKVTDRSAVAVEDNVNLLDGDLIIDKDILEIGENGFNTCTKLTSITNNGKLKKVGNRAFAFDYGVECELRSAKLYCEDLEISNAFINCNKLENVIFNGNVKLLGHNIVVQCSQIKNFIVTGQVEKIQGRYY